jgi:hypothetical protein
MLELDDEPPDELAHLLEADGDGFDARGGGRRSGRESNEGRSSGHSELMRCPRHPPLEAPLAVSALSWWAAGVAAAEEEDVVVVVGREWRRGRQGRGEQGAGPAGEGLI